jgi:hypothetical protein|tara:strand:- start:1628 stop:1783 length:156 start_codon:yes stop_codon:yes gene_type:complete
MVNKVTDQECREALEYFHVQGFSEELTFDKKYYVNILLKKVANNLNIKLEQ